MAPATRRSYRLGIEPELTPKSGGNRRKWLCGAWDVWAHAQQNGDHPVKVHIDPNGFQEWCTAQGFAADSEARLEFAYLAAQAQAAETEILSPTASTCAPALERGGH